MPLFRPVPPGNWSLFFSASAVLARDEEADETAELLQATWTAWRESAADADGGTRVEPGRRLTALRTARQILPDLRDFPQVFVDPLDAVERLASLAALLGEVRAAIWSEKQEAAQAHALPLRQAQDHFGVHTADVRTVRDAWAPAVGAALHPCRTHDLTTHIPGYLDDANLFRCAESIVDTARTLHQAVTETAAAVALLDLDDMERRLAAYDVAEQRSREAAGIEEHPWKLLRRLRHRVEGSLELLDGGYADQAVTAGVRQELWAVGLDLEEAVLQARSDGTEQRFTACSAYQDVLEALQVADITLDRHSVRTPGWQPEPMDIRFPARVTELRGSYLDLIDTHVADGTAAIARAQGGRLASADRRPEDERLPGALRILHARLQIENRRQGAIFTTTRMALAQDRLLETAAQLEALL
ncbi:hypothetical protein [Streptacidiphilus melanogenes]|uniref:hypothetical protein n=1 Tax=Streptacidiphilus melanogenes TaxID=411235 RepID=UPI0005A9C9F8|nr:hypothetical protein [Streptacidiphilus melanogenes]